MDELIRRRLAAGGERPATTEAAPAGGTAEPLPPVTGDTFRAAMRQLAAGVSVVTVGQGEARTGFTATSVTSLAVEPPRLLVCVGRDSSSWPALREAGAFCANVLDASQQWLADRFAGRDGIYGPARYEGVHWHAMPSGAAALAGALASIDCLLEEAIECHSHVILIGAVEAVLLGPAEASPLLYWRGDYRRLDPGS